jgi:hypothetical protein
MATTPQTVAAVRARGVDATDYQVAVMIAPALQAFFKAVAVATDGPDDAPGTADGRRQLIFQDYTVALTSGTGSLSTAYSSSPQLIPAAHKHWRVLVAGETSLSSWLPDRQSINMGKNKLVSYFCADAGTLRTRDRSGSLTGFTGINATVSGPAVLSLANVPTQLEEEFFRTVAEMVGQGGS